MASSRRRSNWIAAVLVMLCAGVFVVVFAFVAFSALFIWANGQPGGGESGDPPRPISYTVRLAWSPDVDGKTYELHLAADDVRALARSSSVVVGDGTSFDVSSPLLENDALRSYCLAGPAEVVEQRSGDVVATVPAGMCIGRRELVIPTEAAPAFDTALETVGLTGRGEPTTRSGELVVRYDGCATIGGRRVLWPIGTYLDESGAVLFEGSTLANGSVVSVRAREVSPLTPDSCPGGPALLVEGLG